MNRQKIIYSFLILFILSLGVGLFYQRMRAQTAFSDFLRLHQLTQHDIQYKTKELSFGGSGIILYQVQLPQFKIAHKIDKLIIRQDEGTVTLQMQGLKIDVLKTLNNYYGKNIIKAVQNYVPFEDALRKPFVSLGLMGFDTIKGDAVFILNPTQNPTQINGKIHLPSLADIQLSFPVETIRDADYRENLFYLGYGNVQEITVEIQDAGLFAAYVHYLKQLGQEDALIYAKELSKHQDFMRHIKFNTPIKLTPFYQEVFY